MRFSVHKIWSVFKVKAVSTTLIFAIGFYCGLAQYILVKSFWPGVESFAGLVFFFGLGIFIGFAIPDIFRPEKVYQQLSGSGLNYNLNILVCNTFMVLAFAVLILMLWGFLVLKFVDEKLLFVYARFLFDITSWRLFAFIVPMIAVLATGIIFGLISDFAYSFLIHFECPDQIRAGSPNVQRCISSLTDWILLATVIGWSLGVYLADICSLRWQGLMTIPIICSLLVILFLLGEGFRMSKSSHHIYLPKPRLLPTGLPELASKASACASLVAIILSGLVIWLTVHIKYSLLYWQGIFRPLLSQAVVLIFLISIFAGIGLKIGSSMFNDKNRYMTTIDKQGISATVFGIAVMVVVFLMSRISECRIHFVSNAEIVLLLSFAIMSFVWGIAFASSIPAIAIGRANRFELWTTIGCRFTMGMMFCAIGYLLWWYLRGNNLSAIIAGALLAIVCGGIAIIYDEPIYGQTVQTRTKVSRIIRFLAITSLYVIIILMVIAIPTIKSSWLKKRINGRQIEIAEGTSATASIVYDNDTSELLWANEIMYERSLGDVRSKTLSIIKRIIKLNAKHSNNQLECLLVGLPFIDRKMKNTMPIAYLKQIDIDPALRKTELKMLNINYPVAIPFFCELYCYHRPYTLIIAMSKRSCERDLSWPDTKKLFSRLIHIAKRPEDVWLISFDKNKYTYSYPNIGHSVRTIVIEDKSGRWRISTASPLINLLEEQSHHW